MEGNIFGKDAVHFAEVCHCVEKLLGCDGVAVWHRTGYALLDAMAVVTEEDLGVEAMAAQNVDDCVLDFLARELMKVASKLLIDDSLLGGVLGNNSDFRNNIGER